jgi:hypothetical protein
VKRWYHIRDDPRNAARYSLKGRKRNPGNYRHSVNPRPSSPRISLTLHFPDDSSLSAVSARSTRPLRLPTGVTKASSSRRASFYVSARSQPVGQNLYLCVSIPPHCLLSFLHTFTFLLLHALPPNRDPPLRRQSILCR